MANVLNRTTKEYLESVDTPHYPESEWLINPDLSAVQGYPPQLWIINDDDTVSPAPPERMQELINLAAYRSMSLDEAKASKKAQVNAQRDIHSNGGWLYKDVMYDSDPTSKQNMSGIMTLVNTGYVLPQDFTFRAADNRNISYNNTTFTAFFQCSCVWAEMIYRTSWYHKAMIDSLTDVASVANYNVTVGWPPGYTPSAS
jgi:hypothetical protein